MTDLARIEFMTRDQRNISDVRAISVTVGGRNNKWGRDSCSISPSPLVNHNAQRGAL